MKIGIASDHRGYEMKSELLKNNNFIDYGTNSIESVDYPIYAKKITDAIKNKEIDLGILICGTGLGMSIAANRIKGMRCAKIDTIEEAILSHQHNNANILAFSSLKTKEFIEESLKSYLSVEPLKDEKYARRNKMLDELN